VIVMRRKLWWALVLLACLGIAAPLQPAVADTGARVVQERRVDARTIDLTISSPSLRELTPPKVRLLLPAGWDTQPARRWPVLYLLHGGGDLDGYRSWTKHTDVEQLAASRDALVVLPDAGFVGYYSDWWNRGQGGPPAWETFHLSELRSILADSYRADFSHAAIAGLSMGGFGALSYAGRHPGLFRAAASYSGVVHTRLYPSDVQNALLLTLHDPDALWGDPVAQEEIWRAHNPYDLAGGLVDIPVFVSCGNGRPGELDPPLTLPTSGEGRFLEMGQAFGARLRSLGGTVTEDFYGNGTHAWPYWERELHRSFPMLMEAIGA
jgi:diacylglycerol O-acyltransferase/trehalose O-mycolyltransferase